MREVGRPGGVWGGEKGGGKRGKDGSRMEMIGRGRYIDEGGSEDRKTKE